MNKLLPVTEIGVVLAEEIASHPEWTLLEDKNKGIKSLRSKPTVCIAYRRGTNKAPITHIGVISLSDNQEHIPSGYEVVEKTVSGAHTANLNNGLGGKDLWLCYTRIPGPTIEDLKVCEIHLFDF